MNYSFDLDTDLNHFKDLYYKDNKGSYFKSEVVGNSFKMLVIGIVLSIGALLVTYLLKMGNGFLAIPFIYTIIVFGYYLVKVSILYKWRRSVNRYLSEVGKIKAAKILLTDSKFAIEVDNKTYIDSWDTISGADILEDHVQIRTKEGVIIPKSTMVEGQFEILTTVLKEKLLDERHKETIPA